jgi:S-adenosylmethionine-diacylglycerol 3-amino-3-carboxypropyl transferase
MRNENEIHQIQLQKLLFTQNWEDPAADNKALRIQPGETLITITSGGCNTLGFLLKDPGQIIGIDINGSQNWLMELKMAAIRRLTYKEFLQFLGITSGGNRLKTYELLKKDLTEEAKIFWDAKKKIIAAGFLARGRFENFVKLAGKMIRLLQGNKRVKKLLMDKSTEDQKYFYDQVWDNKRMKLLFNTLFNKRILAKRGLDADYFHFDDDSASFAESFYNRHRKVLRDIPIGGNYFIAMYLEGKYNSLTEMPEYLLEENYASIRDRLDRIELVTQDAKHWLAERPADSIDCFALSNICELMSLEDTEYLFQEVFRTGKSGSRICFRNLMIPREVPDNLTEKIIKDEPLSQELLATDRSFVYSKVAAYTLNK